MEDKLTTLVSPEFDFLLNGTAYHVRKANLEKAIQFRKRAKELLTTQDDGGNDLRLLAYAIWLVLKDSDPMISEADVLARVPGDTPVTEMLTELGFMKPKMGRLLEKMSEAMELNKKQIGEESSRS